MLVAGLAVLAAVLPALASPHAQPPHLRHRRIADSVKQSRDLEDETRALYARANEGHAEAHRIIKKTVAKRGQQCRLREQASPSASATPLWTAAPASISKSAQRLSDAELSSTIENNQAWAKQSSSSTWASSSPSPMAEANSGSNDAGFLSVSGLLSLTDDTCGPCGSNSDQPNGSEDWLNCGINGGGWSPPHVTMDQLIAVDLSGDGVFSPCSQYIDKFNKYGGEFDVHPIMLASFAMQESTCNAGATGGNGEAGLMQISPPNCESGKNCWDPDYNIRRGAQLFRGMIDSNGGNVLAAIGSYNGYRIGMTYDDATRAKSQGNCHAQNNLDYVYQFCNGWMQNKNAYSMGTYFNLNGC